jgi:hypothetical protein
LFFDFGGLRAFMGEYSGAPGEARSGCCVESVAYTVAGHNVLLLDLLLESAGCVCQSLGAGTAA